MAVTNEQPFNLNLNILTTLANTRQEKENISKEPNIPPQMFGLNTKYFLNSL